jgi:hypothetical protein
MPSLTGAGAMDIIDEFGSMDMDELYVVEANDADGADGETDSAPNATQCDRRALAVDRIRSSFLVGQLYISYNAWNYVLLPPWTDCARPRSTYRGNIDSSTHTEERNAIAGERAQFIGTHTAACGELEAGIDSMATETARSILRHHSFRPRAMDGRHRVHQPASGQCMSSDHHHSGL